MVNYDIPWNPARLEQRMGRIHRYSQKHDPVIILNLVAGKTREGRVLKTLLEKLERIRKELGSDKVFDVIGRLFEGVSIRQYMERALTEKGAAEAVGEVEGALTKEQVAAIEERERRLFGDGGDVAARLPEQRASLEREELRRLAARLRPALPGEGGAPSRSFNQRRSRRLLQLGAAQALGPRSRSGPFLKRTRRALERS